MLNFVVPALGATASTGIYLSPIVSVVRAWRQRDIGDVNSDPYIMLFINGLAWFGYGMYTRDPFVMAGNAVGPVSCLMFCLVAVALTDKSKTSQHLRTILVGGVEIFVLTTVAFVAALVENQYENMKLILGVTGCLAFCLTLISPFTTIVSIIKSKDSSSIDPFLAVALIIDCALWTTYGFVLADPFIIVPSGIGLVSSIVQVLLKLLFLKKRAPSDEVIDSNHNGYNANIHSSEQEDEKNSNDIALQTLNRESAAA